LIGTSSADQGAKDVAAHILAKMISSPDLKGMEDSMKTFINTLMSAQTGKTESEKPISSLGFSAALMHLLKVHDVLQYFITSNGLHMYFFIILSFIG